MLLAKVFIHILKIFTACHPNDILPEGTSRPLTAAASSLRQSLFSTELPGCHSGPWCQDPGSSRSRTRGMINLQTGHTSYVMESTGETREGAIIFQGACVYLQLHSDPSKDYQSSSKISISQMNCLYSGQMFSKIMTTRNQKLGQLLMVVAVLGMNG